MTTFIAKCLTHPPGYEIADAINKEAFIERAKNKWRGCRIDYGTIRTYEDCPAPLKRLWKKEYWRNNP